MRLRFFGGFAAEEAAGSPIEVRGSRQRALLLRLALDAGTVVSYRALAEDVWPDDAPEDPRASLQSLVSRMRRALPEGMLRAEPGGYALDVARDDVDLVRFADLVQAAHASPQPASLAREALALWRGEPWLPDGFDWVLRDLLEDRAHAERLSRDAAATTEQGPDPVSAIPAALTPLVGRTEELALISSQLQAFRLLTLLGPGGAGKTTLALETARHRPPAVFVELAPAQPGEVWGAVVTALGRSIRLTDNPAGELSAADSVLAALAGRSVLLVLDNAEHVLRETAEVAATVLAMPGVTVLVTSREPLGLPGEAFVELGPLPDADATALLAARILAARGTEPTPEELPAVVRIARHLDGLPLALELAGAKARTLGVDELESGLSDRFALFDRGPRSAAARHQTLRAVIDWSWDLLGEPEREGLLALAVFPDGIDAADAGAVAAAFALPAGVFDELVDRSLVQRARGRFRVLETVREYGIEQLRRRGSEERARDAQARVLARRALERDTQLRTPAVRSAIAWFDANEENLAAATRWSGARPQTSETAVELVRAQIWVWIMRERLEALRTALELVGADATLDSEAGVVITGVRLIFASADAQVSGGFTAEDADRIAQAAAAHPSELSLILPVLLKAQARAIGDGRPGTPWLPNFRLDPADLVGAPTWSRGVVAAIEAAIAQNGGDIERLDRQSEQALRLLREVGDTWGIALASQMRSEWLMLHGRLEEALEITDAASSALEGLTSASDQLQQQAFAIVLLVRLGRIREARERLTGMQDAARRDGSDRAVLQASLTAVTFEVIVGDGAAALGILETMPLALRDGSLPGIPPQIHAWMHARHGQALVLAGRLDEARDEVRVGIELAVASGDQPIMADAALAAAELFAATSRPGEARHALALAAVLRGRADETDPVVQRVQAKIGTDAGPDASASGPADLVDLASLV
jgi:predicted ATPase